MNSSHLLFALMFCMGTANASVIAVIDSGTDLTHQDLKDKKWFNPKDVDDAVDNDDNGYIDDVNGWNFAENNNKLYDKTLVGTFGPDIYKFFEVQTRLLKGEGTPEDLTWLRQKQGDKAFIGQLGVFGNFVHGTHVAGITAKDSPQAKIMGLKIIPTKVPTVGGGRESFDPDALIRKGLDLLASQQAKQLAPIGKYVGSMKARIANCSFGTSTAAAKRVLVGPIKAILKRDPTDEELTKYSVYFVNQITKASQVLVSQAPGTLFVIAAGNDGMNNDVLPTSPANIKRDNTITVAATFGYQKIASFSNFGEKMVEVAAPGVGILSSIPGNQYLTVSGTSQASPFVAGVAGMMVDANPALSNTDLKAILMATSDVKDFLKGKVVSGGIVNASRAVLAAKFAKTMALNDAIQSARLQVSDLPAGLYESSRFQTEGFVLPMPSLFY